MANDTDDHSELIAAHAASSQTQPPRRLTLDDAARMLSAYNTARHVIAQATAGHPGYREVLATWLHVETRPEDVEATLIAHLHAEVCGGQ